MRSAIAILQFLSFLSLGYSEAGESLVSLKPGRKLCVCVCAPNIRILLSVG